MDISLLRYTASSPAHSPHSTPLVTLQYLVLHHPLFITMAVTSPISAFYEPGAPPPPVPLLTHQTELYYSPTHSNTLIVQEELPPNPITVKRHNVASLPREPVRFTADPLEDGRASSPSDSGSFESSDSELTDLSDDGLIPKPDGEAGRPGRGGYNLETALNWNPKSFRKLKVRTPFSCA